jgi:hypothetical protein
MGCCGGKSNEIKPEVEPYGPIGKRKCRDVLFLLLFLIFWVGMAIVADQARKLGNPYT